MLLWTIGLIVLLEMVSNNIIEPWLYGSSTGLSAMALMVSATFWTALWGPIGLIMSTPLTVCLLVIGRYFPALQFLDVILGSAPALDAPTRVYQRLLAGDVREAMELSKDQMEASGSLVSYYDQVALPVLRRAVDDHTSVSTAEHRLRVLSGMDALLDDLEAEHHLKTDTSGLPLADAPTVVCLGLKWEVDTLAARMLVHGLRADGIRAEHRFMGTANALAQLDLQGVRLVCVSTFSDEPQTPVRYFCRRLRRRWPGVQVLLTLWNAPPEVLDDAAMQLLGADGMANSVTEAALRARQILEGALSQAFVPAPIPAGDAERVRALRASGLLEDERVHRLFALSAKRAADIFDVPFAMVSLIDETRQYVCATHGSLPLLQAPVGAGGAPDGGASVVQGLPREQSLCGHVVSSAEILIAPDIARDPRFAGNPVFRAQGLRFYAGAPLKDRSKEQHVLGVLCLLDTEPRTFDAREARLLQAMADDLMEEVLSDQPKARDDENALAAAAAPAPDLNEEDGAKGATLGQAMPH